VTRQADGTNRFIAIEEAAKGVTPASLWKAPRSPTLFILFPCFQPIHERSFPCSP
jgi:hypothetical protein